MVRCRLGVFSGNGMPDRSSPWVILSVWGIGSLNDEPLIIAPSPDYTPDPNQQHSLARSEFSPGARSLELCRLTAKLCRENRTRKNGSKSRACDGRNAALTSCTQPLQKFAKCRTFLHRKGRSNRGRREPS